MTTPCNGRFSPGGTSTQATSVKCSCPAVPRLSPQVPDRRDLKGGQEQGNEDPDE